MSLRAKRFIECKHCGREILQRTLTAGIGFDNFDDLKIQARYVCHWCGQSGLYTEHDILEPNPTLLAKLATHPAVKSVRVLVPGAREGQ